VAATDVLDLVPGSVVVTVGAADLPHWDGVTVHTVAPSEDPAAIAPHFRVDALVVGAEAETAVRAWLPVLLPGAFVASAQALPFLGEPERRWRGFHVYRHAPPAETVDFAKLRADEKRWLYDRVRELPFGSVYVEIGSFKGGSAVIAALANPDVTIYAVDPWVDPAPFGGQESSIFAPFDVFRRHTQFFANVVPIQIDLTRVEDGPRLIAEAEGRAVDDLAVDLLFIDGDHSFPSVWRDLELYVPHVRGVASGHNYTNGEGVRKAVATYFATGIRRRIVAAIPEERWSPSLGRLLRPPGVRIPPGDCTIWYIRRAPSG
jgi:hypothetical protein